MRSAPEDYRRGDRHLTVSSILTSLGSLLGVDDADATAAPGPQASRRSPSGASRRSQSAPAGRSTSGARESAPAPNDEGPNDL
ncbi:MAG: hypothetical protein ACXVW5_28505 [Solirubrobacteraceae bacterium]